MPQYFWNQGFERAWSNNRELVGGDFPAEQNDWGFGDGSSITQLRTKHGLLQWVDLVRGGQRITFTDLRENPPRRYVLLDPPDNRLVEVPSPGPQDPDTGQPLGSHDTPSSDHDPPLPGPEPTPPAPEPAPPVNGLLLSAYAGNVSSWDATQPTLDAFRRCHDAARQQGLPIILDVQGQILFETVDDPDLEIYGADWLDPRKIWLFHDARSQDALFKGWKRLKRFSIDGQAPAIDRLTYEIRYDGQDQEADDIYLYNFRFLGIGRDNARGRGGIWRNSHIVGTSPGGNLAEGRNNTAHFGVHTDGTVSGLTIRGGSISGCALNAIFFKGQGGLVEDVDIFDNHRAHNKEGFGGGQVCMAARGGVLRRLRVHDPAQYGSGLELDGDGNLIEDCEVWGHGGGSPNGVTFQQGKHTFRNNRVHHNGVGAHITRGDKGSEIPDLEKQFYANARNVVRD